MTADPASGSTRWVRSAAVVWRTAPGWLVVADPGGRIVRAEGPAPEIWDLLAAPSTVEAMAEELADRYGTSPDAVRPDVARFVSDLADRGVVDGVAAGA
jgi:hypothetical protein